MSRSSHPKIKEKYCRPTNPPKTKSKILQTEVEVTVFQSAYCFFYNVLPYNTVTERCSESGIYWGRVEGFPGDLNGGAASAA